jgi:peptidoglycan/xylan/chitin deacetylase (PgdA/CDA1 family)
MRATSIILSLACAASMVMAAPIAPSSDIAETSDQVEIYTQCNRPGVFALTFDDGPDKYSWGLAKSLQEQGIKATFFINGANSV